MAKRKVIQKDGNLLKIDGKWYRFGVNEDSDFATGQYNLEEVDKEKIDRQTAIITSKLFSFVDPKLVLKDALKDLDDKSLEKLYKYVKNHKGKIKPKIKKHCIQMKVAGVEIPIR